MGSDVSVMILDCDVNKSISISLFPVLIASFSELEENDILLILSFKIGSNFSFLIDDASILPFFMPLRKILSLTEYANISSLSDINSVPILFK